MPANRKTLLRNKFIIYLIYLVLLISNIVLYFYLIRYYVNEFDFKLTLNTVNNILSIIAAIIILGFISTRLPQFRKLGDSSIYEISYLIIIGLLSIIVSYFNKSTNTEALIDPFLNMFKILSFILILMVIATKTEAFKNMLHAKAGRRDMIFILIFFSFLGCLSSVYYIYVNDTLATVRTLIIMIGGLFGGPYIGIPSGIIAALFRLYQGGASAFPDAIATVLSGVIASVIFKLNDGKFPHTVPSAILIFLFIGLEMLLIMFLTPPTISVPLINKIYPLMLFAGVVGMILFKMITKEAKTGVSEISYEELRINELENTLDEYNDKLEQLEEEIELIKQEKEAKHESNQNR